MNQRSDYIVPILFAVSLIGAYSIYEPFLLSLSVAMLLTMATANIHYKLLNVLNSKYLSSSILTSLLIVILFVPMLYIATVGVTYISTINQEMINNITTMLIGHLDEIPMLKEWAQENIQTDKILNIVTTISKAGTTGIAFIKNMLLIILFYFFFNLYAESLFNLIQALLPLNNAKGTKILTEISSTMEIVFYSIIVTAIFEGILFGVMASYFGFNGLLFGMIYGFASLIPIVGGMVVWVPVSLYAWSYLNSVIAVTIALYSIIVISIIADTFVKPMIIKFFKENLLKSSTKISELLIFFSILAGMSSYGFWGMILGPAITAFLIAITNVYIEFNEHE